MFERIYAFPVAKGLKHADAISRQKCVNHENVVNNINVRYTFSFNICDTKRYHCLQDL